MTELTKDSFQNMMASLGTERFFNYLPERETVQIPKSLQLHLQFGKDDQNCKCIYFKKTDDMELNYVRVDKKGDWLVIKPSTLQSDMRLTLDEKTKEFVKGWIQERLHENEMKTNEAIYHLSTTHTQERKERQEEVSRSSVISLKPKLVLKKLKQAMHRETKEENVR